MQLFPSQSEHSDASVKSDAWMRRSLNLAGSSPGNVLTVHLTSYCTTSCRPHPLAAFHAHSHTSQSTLADLASKSNRKQCSTSLRLPFHDGRNVQCNLTLGGRHTTMPRQHKFSVTQLDACAEMRFADDSVQAEALRHRRSAGKPLEVSACIARKTKLKPPRIPIL